MQLRSLVLSSLIASSASAATTSLVSEAGQESKPWSLSVSAGISETPVKRSSSDYYRSFSSSLTAGYKLDLPATSWLSSPSVSLSISMEDEMDYEDGESNLGNADLALSGIGYQINDRLSLSIPVSIGLPTNKEATVYSSYRGRIGVGPALSLKLPVTNLSASLSTSLNYFFYEFETSKAGFYNPLASFTFGSSLSYSLAKASFWLSVSNTTAHMSDGSRSTDSYRVGFGSSYSWSSRLSSSLSWSQRDRTFGYDGISPNINFKYADLSLISMSMSYSI